MGQASCDQGSIQFVRFYLFLPCRLRHAGWGEDDAFHMMLCELVVKGEAQASGLITAYKYGVISIVKAHGIQIIEDFTVVCLYFLAVFRLFFLICIAAERKTFFVYIHSYVNCGIIHLMASICMW